MPATGGGFGVGGQEAIERFLEARQQWLAMLLADWPAGERHEFARLIGRFAGDIRRHLGDLDIWRTRISVPG